MKNKTSFKFYGFLASMLPLFILLPISKISAYIASPKNINFWCSIGISSSLILISIISLLIAFSMLRGGTIRHNYVVKKLTHHKIYSWEYLFTVIIPLFVFDITDSWSFIALFFLLAFMGYLYIKYDIGYFNIFIELAGYKCYMTNLERRDGKIYNNAICFIKDSNITNALAESMEITLKQIGTNYFSEIKKS